MSTEDWRILPWHEEKYKGVTLMRCCWVGDTLGDHDHCVFCWEKFADDEGCLQEGYRTADDHHWICGSCFNDLRERFEWKVQL